MIYQEADGWKKFKNIKEVVDGDVNLDDKVDKEDLDNLASYIMCENPEGIYESVSDINGDKKVNVADLVQLTNTINKK